MFSLNDINKLVPEETAEIQLLDTVDSTNQYAINAGRRTVPLAVIAREQTAGKGTKGRQFFCKMDEGLYLSVIFRPEIDIKTAALATPAAAVAVARAIAGEAGVETQIKWVNDIVFQDKKLCGILTETRMNADGSLDYLVIGIGINLYVKAFPDAIRGTSVSLDSLSDGFDPNRLCAAIINELCAMVPQLEQRAFLAEYRERSSVLGRYVYFDYGGARATGRAVEINSEGNLVVEIEEKRYIVTAGDVSLQFS